MRYYDLKLISNSPQLLNWQNLAKQHEQEVAKLQTKEERKEYFENEPYWRNLRDFLLDEYGDVCWYSEVAVPRNAIIIDVDHFRPKLESKDGNDIILENGYFELAYDYKNYRISSDKINRGNKKTQFPLRDTRIAGQIDLEHPKLLDPCCKEDTELVGYNLDGSVSCLSNDAWELERVRYSKKIYGLDKLDDYRKKIYNDCLMVEFILDRAWEDKDENLTKSAKQKIADMLGKNSAYASVAFLYYEELMKGKEYKDDILEFMKKCYLK